MHTSVPDVILTDGTPFMLACLHGWHANHHCAARCSDRLYVRNLSMKTTGKLDASTGKGDFLTDQRQLFTQCNLADSKEIIYQPTTCSLCNKSLFKFSLKMYRYLSIINYTYLVITVLMRNINKTTKE